MRPESAKYLEDILEAADRISSYTRDKTKEQYMETPELRDAVQWNFAVIGEALGQLHNIDPEMAERITEWRRIIAFRNQLIHGYGVIKNGITWDIIERKVPTLRLDVRSLLGLV